MELKGTKTEANLAAAFAGESQARNKYTYYASKAKKDGYEQIAQLFLETAENEKESFVPNTSPASSVSFSEKESSAAGSIFTV